MAIRYQPIPGSLFVCNFDTGFKVPEMVKLRPVVVVSPRPEYKNYLCSAVPLSTTRPFDIKPYHYLLNPASLPGKYSKRQTWAKCDMISTVSLERLDRLCLGWDNGKRHFASHEVTPEDFDGIQRAVISALGLEKLLLQLHAVTT